MPDLEDRIVELIPRLRRYARALVRGHSSAADDLVQDCLERALSRGHRWRRGSDLRAWLFTILHNLYVNQVRRSHAGPTFVTLCDSGDLGSMPANDEHRMALHELDRAVSQLPPDQREILLLVTVEGMKYREVAAILEIPEGTVMSRLSRAREQLRTAMNGERRDILRRVK